jgi:hypothetical protein
MQGTETGRPKFPRTEEVMAPGRWRDDYSSCFQEGRIHIDELCRPPVYPIPEILRKGCAGKDHGNPDTGFVQAVLIEAVIALTKHLTVIGYINDQCVLQ